MGKKGRRREGRREGESILLLLGLVLWTWLAGGVSRISVWPKEGGKEGKIPPPRGTFGTNWEKERDKEKVAAVN